ncbi:hypothetical protein DFA_02016 [Cavenderia fasciculata]|uniref:Transmembrane protein n=1 Tax=Cavenderia fasciculata TaxID=261658 RepID=F4PYG5_CACFS|nr:uncharacterized protein DFA_02016 [Cavenderia fasciculata]EGG19231.1 hypothetical protein DFA_02016 [Cavenderia fasciculata]|eukprot:XP_004357502.1 hypothetical protein DFA_02016 [Cavenderia fasciculata]
MGHRAKLAGSLFLTLLAIGCIAVAYSFPWYRVVLEPTTDDDINTYYYWTKYRLTNSDNEQISEDDYDDNNKNVKQVFTVSLSFLTAAAFAALGTAIFQIIGIISKSRFIRILSGIGGLAIAILAAIAFFTFFGITKGFDKDNSCLLIPFKDDYCTSFMASSENIMKSTLTFGPYIGWWVTIGSICFGLLSGITSFLA